ncbi:MAG TPA: substrate-binding domain-containing protein, partial [Solirubrobacteraceae bacterium]|nr:substrate-binding domain-containing protein [Solirubrobacteraceae bacterium]
MRRQKSPRLAAARATMGMLCAVGAVLATAAGAARAQTAAAPGAAAAGPAPAITVFAAASLSDALSEIARVYGARGAEPGGSSPPRVLVRTSFAASSVLAKQIEAGAPGDIFLSADT